MRLEAKMSEIIKNYLCFESLNVRMIIILSIGITNTKKLKLTTEYFFFFWNEDDENTNKAMVRNTRNIQITTTAKKNIRKCRKNIQ